MHLRLGVHEQEAIKLALGQLPNSDPYVGALQRLYQRYDGTV